MRNLMRCCVFSMALAAGACSNSSTSDYGDNEGYEQSTSSRDTFMGYNCTDDCSGHEAGYEWAEENGITDPDDCGGNSLSFEEGCRAYAEESGSFSYGSRGDLQRKSGTTFYSDGTTAQTIGGTTFFSDGTTAQTIGGTTFYSDGTTCQTIGATTIC